MARVRFTTHLQKFFPTLQQNLAVTDGTVQHIIHALDVQYPGLAAYLVDERGTLRKHVNIFIGSEMVIDRVALTDTVTADQTIFIMQALSGG